MAERIWLDVPYAEKDTAKAAGARWDPDAKRWYAPRPGMTELQPWAARPDIPALLPGEDRSFGSGLFVDLVPSSCWFTNVRSCVSKQDWERLRRMLRTRAGARCEICGASEDRDTKRWMEAHERWHYDDATSTQSLRRLIMLCTDCHETTHMGLAGVRGRGEQARAHLREVTGMSEAEARRHVEDAFSLWHRRSAKHWHLNLALLTDVGVDVAPPPDARNRRDVAAAELRTARQPTSPTAPPPAPGGVSTPTTPPVRRSWWARLFGRRGSVRT